MLSKKRLFFLMGLIALGAVCLRLTYLFRVEIYENQINGEMEFAAASLARDGYLGNIYAPGKSAHVAPLYPSLLAALYSIFGMNTFASKTAQGIFSILLTVCCFSLLPLIARKAGLSSRAGWLASICLAMLPLNIWLESTGGWEQPLSALAVLGLLAGFCHLHEQRWQARKSVIGLGILIGGTALLSPALLPMVVMMVLAEFAVHSECRNTVIRESALMAAISLVLIAPWIVRNHLVLGGFIPIRSNFGLELAIGNNDMANGKSFTTGWTSEDTPMAKIHPFWNKTESAKLAQLGEREYMRDKLHTALTWIQSHPLRAASLTLKRWSLFYFPPPDMWDGQSRARWVKSGIFCLVTLAALLELLRLHAAAHAKTWLLLAALFGPSLLYALTHVDPRYRYPIGGVSFVLAASLLLALVKRFWPVKSVDQEFFNLEYAQHPSAQPSLRANSLSISD